MEHHRGEGGAVEDEFFRFTAGDSPPLSQVVEPLDVIGQARKTSGLDDADPVQAQPQVAELCLDRPLIAKQDGTGDPLIDQNLAGAENLVLLAFGDNHPLRLALRFVDHDAHDFVRLAEAALQLFLVRIDVDRILGDSALDGRFGDRRGHPDKDAAVKRRRNDVLAAELHAFDAVGAPDRVGDILLRQCRQRASSGQFHFVVDGGGPHIQGAPEDEGKAEDVVHLVGEVRTACRHDYIRAGVDRKFVRDLRVRISHGEHDRVLRHRQKHLRRHAVGHRQA